MSEQLYSNRRFSSRSILWSTLGITLIIAVLSIVVLMLIGPTVGNVFSNITSNLSLTPSPNRASSVPQQSIVRLIIREGSISMVVEDTRATKESIEQMVAEMENEGAFVVSSTERGGTGDRSPVITMVIRIPSTRFDEVMDRLAAMAVEVKERDETAQDVTEEYVDLQARLESLEAARDRLLEIMENAETTEDLLRAEQQLTQREAEIESIKGRIQYLTQSAQLSKIDITLRPYILSQPIESSWRPAETVREAFKALVNSLQGFGNFLIYFSIAILPWLLFIGLIVYGVVRFVKRHHLKSSEEETSETPSQEE